MLLTSCSSIYVNKTHNIGISDRVKKEYIIAEKKIRKRNRELNKYHREQDRKIKKLQKKANDNR